MKGFLLRLLILTAVAVALWWPVADRIGGGPRPVTHGLLPLGFALIALLAWRLLRSLFMALVCAAGIAGVVFLLFRCCADVLRPALEGLWR